MASRSESASSPDLSNPQSEPSGPPTTDQTAATHTQAAPDPMRVLWAAWRETAGTDAPTLNQLLQGHVVRVDVDSASGYVAVVTDEDTHHAIGMRSELVVPLVSVLTRHSETEISALLAKGPGKIERKPKEA